MRILLLGFKSNNLHHWAMFEILAQAPRPNHNKSTDLRGPAELFSSGQTLFPWPERTGVQISQTQGSLHLTRTVSLMQARCARSSERKKLSQQQMGRDEKECEDNHEGTKRPFVGRRRVAFVPLLKTRSTNLSRLSWTRRQMSDKPLTRLSWKKKGGGKRNENK